MSSTPATGKSVPSFPGFRTSTTLPSINPSTLEIRCHLLSMVGILPSLVHPKPPTKWRALSFHIGTSISVYGTLDTPALGGSPNATFGIDGAPPVYFNASGSVELTDAYIVTSHVLLYQSPGLNRDTHTLSVETVPASKSTTSLYIDFFTVSTGSDSASGYVIVDDRDTSIVYTGIWPDAGLPPEYLDTTRQSPNDGNGGSATIRFNGTCTLAVFVSLHLP